MDKRLRIFVDGNIWFYAFYKKGKASNFLQKGLQKNIEVVISELVLQEIVKNIKEKLPKSSSDVKQFLSTYPLTIIKNPLKEEIKKFQNLADKKDLPILVSAINYQCPYFITGNLKDFKIKKIEKLHKMRVINLSQVQDQLFYT